MRHIYFLGPDRIGSSLDLLMMEPHRRLSIPGEIQEYVMTYTKSTQVNDDPAHV